MSSNQHDLLQTPEAEKPACILVVDDEPRNIALLAGLLKNNGYLVRAARNAEQAFKSLKLDRVDLILLDILMPQVSGYEFCEQLKKDKTTSDIPVIFLSAIGEIEDKVKGLALGAVDYITKPFNPDEVIARIARQLKLKSEYRKKSGLGVYRKTGLETETRQEICRLLTDYFEQEKPYLSDELSASQIAEKIGVTLHNLSESVNIELQQNISHFINRYRVDYFCEKLQRQPDASILDLAIKSGFKSKSVFNHWFKTIKNTTPKKYLKAHSGN